MKRIVSIFLVFLLIIACTFAAVDARNEAHAADPTPTCTVQVSNVVCVLAGVTILNSPINIPTVHVPGPTVTVSVPPVTQTVHIPGPTQTVTLPGGTQTITVTPAPATQTVTAPNSPSALPTATVTTTVQGGLGTTTVTSTPRQPQPTSGTLDPSGGGPLAGVPRIVKVTGVGVGIIALLALLILLGLYGGYYMGYKDSDRADANFFRALLNNSKE